MLPHLDRYIVSRVARILTLGIVSFVIIYVVVNLIENLNQFMTREIPVHQIALYYLYYVPYILVLTLPVAMLLATLFAVGGMGTQNELVAIKAAGIGISRVAWPLWRFGFLVSVIMMLIAELIVPLANQKRTDIVDVKRRSSLSTRGRHICRQDPSGYTVYVAYYSEWKKQAAKVTIVRIVDDVPMRRIDARRMTWDREGWLLHDVTDRSKGAEGARYQHVEQMRLPELRLRPDDFARVDRQPESMGYFDLRSYIRRVRTAGGDPSRWLVDLHLKIAFPLANLVMVWIGFPIAARSWRGGRATYIGLTLLIAFVYFVFLRGGQALGRSGGVDPLVGAWAANTIFFIIGVVLLRFTRR
jgi:lipopolysaccharide export system permease protein